MLDDKWCKIVGGCPRVGSLSPLRIYAIFSFATELRSYTKSMKMVSGTRVSLRGFYPQEKSTNCVGKVGKTAEKLDRRCTTRSRQQVVIVSSSLLTTAGICCSK